MYKIIKEEDWVKSTWSSGETNQLYIYPEEGNYQERDFNARISIATTSNEDSNKKSVFTKLPGFNRCISVLDGDLHLFHEGHYDLPVKKYEIARFNGAWTTYSKGNFRDFNLMLKNTMGDFYYREIKSDTKLVLQKGLTFSFVYVIEGTMKVNEEIEINENEIMVSDQNVLNVSSDSAKIFYGFVQEW